MKNDLAYNNVDHIPGGPGYPEKWETLARDFREVEASVGRARLNEPYGSGHRQKLDIFYPAGRPVGLVVFVHGGYWLRFDRSIWSHLATGPTAKGFAVAMPSYTLAPEARISNITREIAVAVTHAASYVSGPLRLVGHSAGGHLVARMLCEDIEMPGTLRDRIERVVPISPVADLRPLLETSMNDELGLDTAEAETESPALQAKSGDTPVTVWVGSDERPVFLDQARWLAEAWPDTDLVVEKDRHHFNVIEGLLDGDSALTTAILS